MSGGYLVVAEDGAARVVAGVPCMPDLRRLFDDSPSRVALPHFSGMAGWVAARSHATRGRNVVGTLVMMALGMEPYPLAGAVVVAGCFYDSWGGPHELDGKRLPVIAGLWLDMAEALGRPVPAEMDVYRPRRHFADGEWVEAVEAMAAFIGVMPTPGMTVEELP